MWMSSMTSGARTSRSVNFRSICTLSSQSDSWCGVWLHTDPHWVWPCPYCRCSSEGLPAVLGGADAGWQGPAAAQVTGTGQTGHPGPKRTRRWRGQQKGWSLEWREQSSGSERRRQMRNDQGWKLWAAPLMSSLWKQCGFRFIAKGAQQVDFKNMGRWCDLLVVALSCKASCL